MRVRSTSRTVGVFFWALGCVCAGPAIAQSGFGPGDPANPAEQEEEVVDLFQEQQDDKLPQGQTVEVGSFGQIDLHVKDLDLTKVLQLLSIQSQKNIIASKNVAGSISADLYGVDFYEALDAILHTNGFGYREKGNFIYVYTLDELQAIEDANRQLVHKVVRMNYLTAKEAADFVSPLLSQAGTISVTGEASAGFQPSISDGGANSFAHADTLIIRDYPEHVEEILSVLNELDVRPKQVLIEATVLQASLNEANAFGVDFAVFADLDVTDFASPLSAVNNLISGAADGGEKFDSGTAVTANPGNVQAGRSTIKVGFMNNEAAVFVRALDEVTDTTVLARPSLLVLNRQKAELLVGQKLGFISTTATETSQTQSVEFLDVGTQLTVRPFVSSDDMVRLEMRPSVSDGTVEERAGFVIPNEITQELTTNVIVRSGQTVVLGGLFKEDTTIGRSQVPVAGDIPLLGAAFQGRDDTVQRSEVIFMIKPTVMKDQKLTELGDRAAGEIEKTRVAARQGLLPWSRTKLTSAQMQQALKAYESGNKSKALWHANMALHLNPTFVDALKLKEELTGEQTYFHEYSILEKAIDDVIDREMSVHPTGQDSAVPVVKPRKAVSSDPDPVPVLDDDAIDAERDWAVEEASWQAPGAPEASGGQSAKPTESTEASSRSSDPTGGEGEPANAAPKSDETDQQAESFEPPDIDAMIEADAEADAARYEAWGYEAPQGSEPEPSAEFGDTSSHEYEDGYENEASAGLPRTDDAAEAGAEESNPFVQQNAWDADKAKWQQVTTESPTAQSYTAEGSYDRPDQQTDDGAQGEAARWESEAEAWQREAEAWKQQGEPSDEATTNLFDFFDDYVPGESEQARQPEPQEPVDTVTEVETDPDQ